MSKRGSKQQRLMKVITEYRRRFSGLGPIDLDRVAKWAILEGIYPVPGVRDSAEACAQWDARFEEVTKQQD